jgi:uncharacterized membrane protein YbhN (UPF0104 family)
LRRAIGPVLIVVTLAYLLTFEVEPRELLQRMARFDPGLLAQVVMSVLTFHLLGAASLWWMARALRPLGFIAFATAYWRSLAVGQWAPTGVSDASLVWFLLPRGVGPATSVALLTVDKLITLTVMLSIAAASPWLVAIPWGELRASSPIALAAGLGAVLVLLTLLWTRSRRRVLGLVLRVTREIRVLSRWPGLLLGNGLLTVAKVATGGFVLWLCAASFEPVGSSEGLGRFLVLATAARLLAFLLPTPNGIGVYEVAVVRLVGDHPFSAAGLLAGALLTRLVSLVLVTLGLLVPEPAPETAPERPR